MTIIENITKREQADKQFLNALFQEEVAFSTVDTDYTYSEYTVEFINGIKVPDYQRVTMYFHKDDHIPKENRNPDYRGSLVTYIQSDFLNLKNLYRNNLKFSQSNTLLSIYKVIDDLYHNRKQDIYDTIYQKVI